MFTFECAQMVSGLSINRDAICIGKNFPGSKTVLILEEKKNHDHTTSTYIFFSFYYSYFEFWDVRKAGSGDRTSNLGLASRALSIFHT